MARNVRQSKIIEIINKYEIDTQEELVSALKDEGFNVTQATVSRDIKELSLFKVTGEKKKYRYAFVENEDKATNSKNKDIFKTGVVGMQIIGNQLVIKVVRGIASAISSYVERAISGGLLGCVYGDDTVLAIADSNEAALKIMKQLNNGFDEI